MTALRSKISLIIAGLLVVSTAWISSAMADDMEIYNMTNTASTGGDVNIVFMLDNSGSMKWCIDSTSGSDCTTATNSRMYALRNAMAQVLNKLNDNTKVALFTYGRKDGDVDGGTMLAPMRALNAKLPDGVTTHRQYMLNWFEDATQTGNNRYIIANEPPNWKYNFGPTTSSTLNSDPPTCASTSGTGCSTDWNGNESAMYPRNSTPLESAYAEIGSYLMGLKASQWGITYLTRSGNLVQMGTYSSGYNTYYSKKLSTLNVASTAPLSGSGTDYNYLQPSYTATQSCVTPSWHVILVTDGEPNNDGNRSMFKDVMGAQSTCSTSTTWSCSKELALFLAKNTVTSTQYSWTCNNNCSDYLDQNGVSTHPGTPASTYCDSKAENGTTKTTSVQNYKAYNWTCSATGATGYGWVDVGSCSSSQNTRTCNDNRLNSTRCMSVSDITGAGSGLRSYTCKNNAPVYDWVCSSGSNGGACTDSSKPAPSDACSSGLVNTTATTYGNSVNRTVTWQCNAQDQTVTYDSGLPVSIKTDAIFVGPDASTDAKNQMTEITNNGGGIFKNSQSVDDLAKTLIEAVTNAEKEPNTISAPGVAVNQLSRFQHLDQLYYSVFQPEAKGVWEGNLKRFVLKDDTVEDSALNPAIDTGTKFFKKDADSCWGADDPTGKQKAGCVGYTQNDGNDSSAGGMRSKIDSAARNMLTTTDGTSVTTLESLRLGAGAIASTVTSSADLMGYNASCASSTAQYCNGALTSLGADLASQITGFNALIDWAKGVRTSDSTSMLVGDPLHSQPVLVNYGFTGDSGTGTTRSDAFDAALLDGYLQENYVFFSTNGGTLHAVNAKTGEEKFSFIPKEMLPLLPKTMVVPAWTGTSSRIYGLDSTWVPWRHDDNSDGDIKDTGDWAYLYGGMRMGGSNYYALDVTNITSPTIKWTIKGPLTGGFSSTTDSSGYKVYRPVNVATLPTGAFAWMGQTWSKPVLARIALKDSTGTEVGRTVLVFGGGYDPTNETTPYTSSGSTITPASTFGTDAYGHQLYIVDAKTGNLLFWAAGGTGTYGTGTTTAVTESPTLTVADMKYSITSSPVPVDRDGDGFTDLIYFADLGGQVFRLDLKNKGTNNGTATTCASTITSACSDMVMRVSKLASLGEAATASSTADQRRFFESPGVGILQRTSGSQYMGVAIGSGNRSHPAFIGTQDRIYVFQDDTALTTNLSTISAITALTHSNLQDVTSYSYDASALATYTGKKGFFFDVSTATGTGADGEKVFSTPLIYQGTVYATTYIPESNATASASNQCSPGTGSSSLAIFNVFDGRAESEDATNLLDRTVEGITSTITGDVQIVFNADGRSTLLAGTYTKEATSGNKGLRRTRWYEMPRY